MKPETRKGFMFDLKMNLHISLTFYTQPEFFSSFKRIGLNQTWHPFEFQGGVLRNQTWNPVGFQRGFKQIVYFGSKRTKV